MGSALAKNEEVGVKQIEFVGVKGGAVGLNIMCFSGVLVFVALCAGVGSGGDGSGVVVGGGVVSGGVALCLCVKRLRLICFSLAIFCWWVVIIVVVGEVGVDAQRAGVCGVDGGEVVVGCVGDGSVGSVVVAAGDVGGDGVGSMYDGRPGSHMDERFCGVRGADFVGVVGRGVVVVVGVVVVEVIVGVVVGLSVSP